MKTKTNYVKYCLPTIEFKSYKVYITMNIYGLVHTFYLIVYT